MRIAVISDIHGKLVALNAVLDDLSKEYYDEIICLGDIASHGPQPVECLRRIRGLGCRVVMGNTDARLRDQGEADPSGEELHPMRAIDLWCASQLSDADWEFIDSFETSIEYRASVLGDLLFCHATPRSDADYLVSTTPDRVLEEMIADTSAAIIIGGHVHIQMLRRHGNRTIVNVGSVGSALARDPLSAQEVFPLAPWAEYAIVTADGPRFNVDFRRIAVDVDEVYRPAFESHMPHAQWLKDHVDRGLIR